MIFEKTDLDRRTKGQGTNSGGLHGGTKTGWDGFSALIEEEKNEAVYQ